MNPAVSETGHLQDNTPLMHRLVRVVLFLTSFSWTFNPIEDYMGGGTSIEKIISRMIPMLIVAAYALVGPGRRHLRQIWRPSHWPILWYILMGVMCGISSIQPALVAWKGAEIFILLMWITVSCPTQADTKREFVAIARCVEILLWATIILAIINPGLGLRRSASLLPWLQGYLPMLNPNAIGFLSLLAIIRLLFLPAKAKPIRLLIVSGTLLCSQSRTSYAVMALVLMIFVIEGLRMRAYGRVVVASALALCTALFSLGALDTLMRVIMRGQSIDELDSLSGRTDYWTFAFQYISWFGEGLATGSRSLIFLDSDTFHKGSVNMHNSFIEALLGAGYVGALPFLLMLTLSVLRQAWRALAHPNIFNAIFLSCAMMFAARGMTSIVLALFSFDMLLLFIFLACLNATQNPATQPQPANAIRPRPIVHTIPLAKQQPSGDNASTQRIS
ncbi:MAG: O-antigen ligase family protein [Proteobacteria bacterium]|nr:O-antigen ligase family protein [Pseudomonadota bacterium]